jgi:hypothetical protein
MEIERNIPQKMRLSDAIKSSMKFFEKMIFQAATKTPSGFGITSLVPNCAIDRKMTAWMRAKYTDQAFGIFSMN